jgi:hypothetical protein
MSGRKKREWTVMFYLASDNPLAPGVVSHLKALKNAGYHPQVNVIAQFDPHGANLPVHIFEVNGIEKLEHENKANIGFEPGDSYVRNLVVDKLWDSRGKERIRNEMKKRKLSYTGPVPFPGMMEEDEPKESLTRFLEFCHKRFPARHYMLFLLGHGQVVGGNVFLFDEHGKRTKTGIAGPGSLQLKELGEVLTNFKKRISRVAEFELVAFHCCSMSSVEVAYELKDTANYMLAAQGPMYVGSLPYRQILIRLFNDLGRSPFSEDDLKHNKMIDNLLQGETCETFDFMRAQFNGNGMRQDLKNHVVGQVPRDALVAKMADKFSEVLAKEKLYDELPKSPALRKLIKEYKPQATNGDYLKWVNRQLLLSGLGAEAKTAYSKINIKRLLISIFDYCVFNNYDFQLAGYSSDLTLCDLRKVGMLKVRIRNLVKALTSSLKAASAANDPRIADLLVLAHWQAQSFYEEKYTDLYDFCFCLKERCQRVSGELPRHTTALIKAADDVMEALRRVPKEGEGQVDDRLIVRSEPSGPAYQYAHGFSIYFPWSEPINDNTWDHQYSKFKFNYATAWRSFLESYFEKTRRLPQEDEGDQRDPCELPKGLPESLLFLFEDMNTGKFYDYDGQLKIGSKDPLGGGKSGSLDPVGSDCECGSIKNYPRVSHTRSKGRYMGRRAIVNLCNSNSRRKKA